MKSIIELAREAGIKQAVENPSLLMVHELTRFATLHRAQVLDEAADICDRVNNYDNPMTAGDCADAIRALKSRSKNV